MFNNYSDLKFEVFKIMNEKSEIVNPDLMPKISDELLLKAHRFMCLSRKQEEIQTEISERVVNILIF